MGSRVGGDGELCFCKGGGCCVGVEGRASEGRGWGGMCGRRGVSVCVHVWRGGSQE